MSMYSLCVASVHFLPTLLFTLCDARVQSPTTPVFNSNDICTDKAALQPADEIEQTGVESLKARRFFDVGRKRRGYLRGRVHKIYKQRFF